MKAVTQPVFPNGYSIIWAKGEKKEKKKEIPQLNHHVNPERSAQYYESQSQLHRIIEDIPSGRGLYPPNTYNPLINTSENNIFCDDSV